MCLHYCVKGSDAAREHDTVKGKGEGKKKKGEKMKKFQHTHKKKKFWLPRQQHYQ
jgi:hypothetical protein